MTIHSSADDIKEHVSSNLKAGTKPYKKQMLLLIIAGAFCRLMAARVLELGNDEAYYWLYSQHLQWNYFDHPPMVAAWIRLFTFDLSFQHEAFIRLGSMTGCALSSWFIFKTVSTAHSEKAGWFTACLFNISFYVSVTAGVYILPDSPQVVFWTFSLWMIARILSDDRKWMNWILLGFATGLCIMSKVHGVFVWSGLILFVIFQKRKWLKDPRLYIAMMITLIIISPIVVWNIQNDFINYRFHSSRVSLFSTGWKPAGFFTELLSQVAFNHPVNVLLVFWALRKSVVRKSPVASVFQFIGWPLAIILIYMSLTRETFPHWSGPAYVSLLPIAGMALAEKHKAVVFPKILWLGIGSFLFVVMCGIILICFYPGTWGNRQREHLGQGDFTLDMYGWKKAGNEFKHFYENELNTGHIPAGSPLVCTFWSGAHVEYYFARPAGLTMIGLGPVQYIHQYHWTNQFRKNLVNLDTAFCITPSEQKWPTIKSYELFYGKIELIKEIEILRNREPAHNFKVYMLTGFKGDSVNRIK